MHTSATSYKASMIESFRDFCGREQYEKFVRRLNEKNELAYWQQTLWKGFCDAKSIDNRADRESVAKWFRCGEIRVPLSFPKEQPTPPYSGQSFIRGYFSSYDCEEPQPPPKVVRDPSSGETMAIGLGPHRHSFEFAVVIDWAGSSDDICIYDDSEKPPCLGIAETELPLTQFNAFMKAVRDAVVAEAAPDLRLATFLPFLQIGIRSFQSGSTYGPGADYTISAGYASPCNVADMRHASGGILAILKDLAAELRFGTAPQQKSISLSVKSSWND